jgi:predicted molibdopterin-dependent oxidoreductase YjgC
LHHKSGFYYRSTGSKGLINKDGSICRYGKFGYRYLNDKKRITSPLLKENGEFREITFEKACEIIAQKIKSVQPGENGFYAGARLTNEEIYLVQRLARAGAKTNNISSFHYMDRGSGYFANSRHNVPMEQIKLAKQIFVLGSEINMENAVPGFYAHNSQYFNGTPINLVTTSPDSSIAHKANSITRVRSYYHFLKAANHYILANGLENAVFIGDHCSEFNTYRESLLQEDFEQILGQAGCTPGQVAGFVEAYNKEHQSIILYSEKHLSANACHELHNLNFLTGKSGKMASGGISLKEKNNSQGIFDMGGCAALAPGGKSMFDKDVREKLAKAWNVDNLSDEVIQEQWQLLKSGRIRQAFIFGEDPVGCSIHPEEIREVLSNIDFLVVQDLFMSDTAKEAHLVLPASLHFETGGSYSNTQRFIQQFEAKAPSLPAENSLQQIGAISMALGLAFPYQGPGDVMLEAAGLMQNKAGVNGSPCPFIYTEEDNPRRMFEHGCDHLVKSFDAAWNEAFQKT